MQNVGQDSSSQVQKLDKMSAHEMGKSSTPQSSNSSPTKSDTDPYSEVNPRYLSDSSESEDEDVSLVESFVIDQVADLDETEARLQSSKFLLAHEDADSSVDPETQARLEALLEAAGIGKLASGDGKQLADPEVLRRLTSSVSCALDEAAAALTRMRSENPRPQPERSLVEACTDGDVGTVRKLLTEGRSVHETTDEGESLLSLACSAGYYELAQVLLAMHANVEDRGIKGDCTPLMEAASSGYVDIVRLLIHHGADVNAQSSSGNTPLMYACAGGHVEAVRVLLDAGANVEDHNENGHTPLMEAASAGHVPVAEILLARGAGINTHSNEFKESALTLACYKGHLDMVRFLLDAGADQEHKTDEMHTALMEASMDGHVEVARLLLDSGAQVNMPTDSFESPLTLAACGGHVDLALLLIERGANIEEVNDEGYTPLMEAAREGHEDMVAVLLVKGANINAQTEETQETALTLACCGGFLEVANFLIKNGAEIELGASTPLMEAAQEGHLELVRYLLEANADVNAQTQTGDTALTYACENGHTEVAKLLLQYGADMEHESEGGRTPLMKACRAGHLCTVKFLLSQNANVNKQTTNNDHTPLSLAAAGGHIAVVELLLAHSANPFHKLKDNSTMLIEAAKGGHTNVVQLLLDYPHSIMMRGGEHGAISGGAPPANAAANAAVGLHEVPNAIRAQDETKQLTSHSTTIPSAVGRTNEPTQPLPNLVGPIPSAAKPHPASPTAATTNPVSTQHVPAQGQSPAAAGAVPSQKSLLRKSRLGVVDINTLTSPEAQQVRNQPPLPPLGGELPPDDPNKGVALVAKPPSSLNLETQFFQRQQIVEELQRVEQELKERATGNTVFLDGGSLSPTGSLNSLITPTTPPGPPPDPSTQGMVCGSTGVFHPGAGQPPSSTLLVQGALPAQPPATAAQPPPAHPPIAPSDVVQATAISDRPKVKATWKKEGKNNRKQNQAFHAALQQQQQQYLDQSAIQHLKNLVTKSSEAGDGSGAGGLVVGAGARQPTIGSASGDLAGTVAGVVGNTDVATLSALSAANGGLLAANGTQPAANGQPTAGKNFVKLPAMIRHSDVVNQLRTQQEDLLVLQQLNEIINGQCTELMHRAQADEDALISLAKAGKLDKETLDSFIPEEVRVLQSVEDIANMSPADRDRMRFSFIAGMSAASQLIAPYALPAAVPELPVVGGAAASWHKLAEVAPLDGEKAIQGGNDQQRAAAAAAAAAVAATRDAKPHPLPAHQMPAAPQGLPPPAALNVGAAPPPNAASFLKAPPPWAKDLGGTTPGAGGREQVQAGTQTSPAPEPAAPPPTVTLPQQPIHQQQQTAAVPVAPKKSAQQATAAASVAGAPTHTKNRRTRFHLQQKSTQAPPIHPDSNHGQTGTPGLATPFGIDVDSATDSNNDTALTLACAGGHEELCELLLSRGANIEHRDKKGFTPLILAATAGHDKVVEILMNHQADMEAQSERTKDTPLSLACSGGRYEVVELLLSKGANKEHRNVSDYTPLSLAASGGYVNIIKLLLTHGAEINSRTGSKLGISPLMLAAMNGHTTAVKLLLDMGSDINAQIETNRNTALTLACFQGRHEVVSLLLDRRANVEHRAKTGLTPLMEAASGGYVEVGRVLLDKGADVNAPPVPSSRDTALTIAADKGHCRFVELLLNRNAQVEVKNKKGNSPLWLAANGGHLAVVELLYSANADIDSQDNRKVSCLMAAFRKGHVKVVKWMVNHVTQFPSDQEMTRYIATVNDKELLEKCQECTIIIRAAKDQQAAKANKNATILLEELYMEKTREESKRAAAARRRERKKKKKMEKKEEKRKLLEENQKNERYAVDDDEDEDVDVEEDEDEKPEITQKANEVPTTSESPARGVHVGGNGEVEEGDSGIDANSQGSCSSNEVKGAGRRKEKKKKKQLGSGASPASSSIQSNNTGVPTSLLASTSKLPITDEKRATGSHTAGASNKKEIAKNEKNDSKSRNQSGNSKNIMNNQSSVPSKAHQALIFEPTRHPADREDFEATGNDNFIPAKGKKSSSNYLNYATEEMLLGSGKGTNSTSPKQAGKRDEGWKEVVRKYLNSPFRSKKVSVPLNAISRVIGRGGSNINAIRTATGAHIEVEKQSKGQGERIITLKGSLEATKQAHLLIAALVKDPDVDILQILPKSANKSAAAVWEKSVNTAKSKPGKGSQANQSSAANSKTTASTAKRLAAASSTKTTMSYTSAIMTSTSRSAGATTGSGGASAKQAATAGQTFAAKLSSMEAGPIFGATAPLTLQSQLPPTSSTIVVNSSMHLTASIGSTAGFSTLTITPPISSVVPVITNSSQTVSPALSTVSTCAVTSSVVMVSPPQPQQVMAMSQPASPPLSSIAVRPPGSPAPNHHQHQANASLSMTSPVAPAPIGALITNSPLPPQRGSLNPSPPPPPQASTPGPVGSAATSSAGSPSSVGANVSPSTAAATLEYSLFNDNFPKVSQQSMWGGGRDDVQRREGMNFASAAAAGGAPNSASNMMMPPTINKYLDPSPPKVDASKAPGYRGSSVCSPVSKGTSAQVSTSAMAHSPNASAYFTPAPGGDAAAMSAAYRGAPPPQPVYQAPPPPTTGPGGDLGEPPVGTVPYGVSAGGVPTSSSVAMSRLNPRAPDFSTNFKSAGLYGNTGAGSGGGTGNAGGAYLQQAILPNSNVISFPMGKYPGAGARANGTPAGGRWPMMANHYTTANHTSDVSQHLASLGMGPQSADLLGPLENGSSPNVSPTSPQQQPPQDDRKVPPRPIGTERAWKNYTSMTAAAAAVAAANAPEIDMATASWMMADPKINWQTAAAAAAAAAAGLGAPSSTGAPGVSVGAGLDARHHMFRPGHGHSPVVAPPPVGPPFSRIPLQGPDDLPHMLDTSYQGGLDGCGFGGGAGGLSMMHTQLVMPQHYATAAAVAAAAAAGADMSGSVSAAEWDQQQSARTLQDLQEKTHYYCSSQGWTPKWSH
ncbi:multiple ankyrin repeats single kh domain [Nesidiocoris tenuis]|uniref:Multiple ankyrin repeats single kh domain n=1 Tax=Nesidiocoris tenuis TaxID=355587 RepID=A0ABN7ALR3_9HEMI|nr:multiple ankyrin repeats single kh domain [Nesidiocoris tenuis]